MAHPTTAKAIYAFVGSAALISQAIILPASQAPPAPAGSKIFAQKCAPCHGNKAQGGAAFTKPLVGDLSVSELSKFIREFMPPGSKKLSQQDASSVAKFLHETYYSPLAQERNRPARVTLSRLTVKQFRNSVADLVGWSHPSVPAEPPKGLKGDYFKGRGFDVKQRGFERVDPEVSFDFGTAPPAEKDFEPHNFGIVWQGSILAPDSGDYEFILRSDHAVRMWINGQRQPLVDGWVRAVQDIEFRGSMHLLGGRAYPVRIEFSKATQGVNDDDKKKVKPAVGARVALLWKRPKRTVEVIPSRNLYSAFSASTFIVSTPFPADDRSIGYERGNTVSKAWDDATTAAALEAGGYVSANLPTVTGVPENAPDRKDKLKAYCLQFVERAFRRPLTPENQRLYIDRQFETAPNLENAVKRVVILTLKSPRFLYREIGPPQKDAFLVASHLSFGLWDSVPDLQLKQAAASGKLNTPEQITAHAERLANDPRAWNKLRDFLFLWLKVDDMPDIVKSQRRFPEFTDSTASDLRTSLELFLENAAWTKSSYRELIVGQTQYLNGKLAKMYGVDLPATAPFQEVKLDPDQRAGVMTHPYVLSRFAYLETSSPIHRGVIVARSLLGRNLQPPPAAFTPLAPSLHPSLTTRERVALQTKPDGCNSCHSLINPLGFTMERFDAIGRLRSKENGKAVDGSGGYKSKTGVAVKFAGAPDMAKYIANSSEAQTAFVEKLFQHLVKQPVMAYGPKTLPDLQKSFKENDFDIRKLMVQVMVKTKQ